MDRIHQWLVLVLAIVIGYLAWRIEPLRQKLDAVERERLAAADRTLAEVEGLTRQIVELQAEIQVPTPSVNDSTQAANAEPTSAPAVPRAATPAPQGGDFSARPVPDDGLEFVDRHLLPSDALIARLMVGNVPPPEIARETNHSKAFILARAAQIEKMVAGAPGAPVALVRTLRHYLQDHSSVR
jgi:hypothetical protein